MKRNKKRSKSKKDKVINNLEVQDVENLNKPEESKEPKKVKKDKPSKNPVVLENKSETAMVRGNSTTNEVTAEKTGLLRFKKVGAGVFRHKGRIYKENEVFYSRFEDIPKAFLNQIICLDPKELIVLKKKGLKQQEEVKKNYAVFTKIATNGGLFNIINTSGKLMNEEPLSEKDAEKMLKILNP